MLEFKKLCNDYEKLSFIERGLILTDKSVKTLAKLAALGLPDVDPIETLASFIIGAVVADGKVSEQEYLLIYPSLVKAFGDDFDFNSIKEAFKQDKEGRALAKKYAKDLMSLLAMTDESLTADVLELCLCVLSVDGKISLKERRYLKQLLS